MAVTYKAADVATETDNDENKFNLFYQFKKKIARLYDFIDAMLNPKKANIAHSESKLEVAKKEQSASAKKETFFPIQHKNLMQASLALISDPNTKTKLKQTFKKVVTDESLSTEDRDKKIKVGLSYVAKYLHKNGAIEAATDLLTKLKQTSESEAIERSQERNLPLEYRIANLALEWDKQNKVWQSPVKMLTPQKDQQVNATLAELVAPKSLAEQLVQELNKNFMPSFSNQRLTQPSLSQQFSEIAFIEPSEPVKKLTALKYLA